VYRTNMYTSHMFSDDYVNRIYTATRTHITIIYQRPSAEFRPLSFQTSVAQQRQPTLANPSFVPPSLAKLPSIGRLTGACRSTARKCGRREPGRRACAMAVKVAVNRCFVLRRSIDQCSSKKGGRDGVVFLWHESDMHANESTPNSAGRPHKLPEPR
jgi:hypothetical protein